MSNKVDHKRSDQLNTALSLQMAFIELTPYYHILMKTRDKIVTKQLPTSVELKTSKILTNFNDARCIKSMSDSYSSNHSTNYGTPSPSFKIHGSYT